MNSNGKSSPLYDSRLEDQPSKSAVYSFASPIDEASLEGGLEVGRILDVIKRRLFVILGVTSVVMGLAVAWNRTRPPAYAGNFRLLIESVTAEEKISSKLSGQQAGGTQNLDSNQPSESKLDYPTQIQLLLSPKLLMPVVQKLKNTNPKITYEALKGGLVITRFKDPEITKILDVNYQSAVSREAEQVINLVAQTYIRYSLNERQTNVRRAVQFLDEQLPKVQSQVKALEAALQNFRERNQLIDPGTLGTQIGSEISSAQQQMLETQIELTKTRQLYTALGQQLQMQPRSAEAASVLSDAPDYQQLVKELQDLDVDIQTQSSELTPNHPKVLALQEKRQRLLPLIQQKAEAALGNNLARSIPNAQALPYQNELRQGLNKQFVDAAIQVQVLESKEKGLNTILQTLAVKSGQLPLLSRQYEDLQRRLKIASDQLSKFLQTREELMISAARQEVPWEIVASPTVQKVSSASLPRDLVLGTILGLLLGIGVALLLEAVTNVIYSLKDLRSELTLPILGTVPKQSSVEKMLPSYDEFMDFHASRYQFSPFIESFRSLNSQLRLLRPDVPIQSLVISSSLPDEGKSTIATQLAQAA
ncbi:MAG TPA: Wzz/FepE/Etk N-terminal domain-containing protein, partial [Stenomitos sp.]